MSDIYKNKDFLHFFEFFISHVEIYADEKNSENYDIVLKELKKGESRLEKDVKQFFSNLNYIKKGARINDQLNVSQEFLERCWSFVKDCQSLTTTFGANPAESSYSYKMAFRLLNNQDGFSEYFIPVHQGINIFAAHRKFLSFRETS